MNNDIDLNQGIFDKKEMALKLKIRGIRDGIIDNFVADGIPTDNRDIRLLNEIMSSVDNEVTETAKLRNANTAQQGDQALKLAILEKLSAPVDMPTPMLDNTRNLLEVDVLNTSLKEGEELSLDDFIEKD